MDTTQITSMLQKIQGSLDGLKAKVESLSSNGAKREYSEGYDEGYSEGYAEAKSEYEKAFVPTSKKVKTGTSLEEYVELICSKVEIKRKLVNCRNRIDIYYEGGSSKGWRNSCTVMDYFGGNIVKVYYYQNSGHKNVRSFNLNKIKMIKNNEMEAIEAIAHYEEFHKMPEGSAKLSDVVNSSAGISGWMNSYGCVVQDDLVEKFENLEFNLGTMSSASKTNGKKRRP